MKMVSEISEIKKKKHKIHGQFVALKLRINIFPVSFGYNTRINYFFSSFTQDTQKLVYRRFQKECLILTKLVFPMLL